MINLTLEQLLELHILVVNSTGGSASLRDLGRLETTIATQSQNVFGDELYPSILDKAAAIIKAIIAYRPFVDSNKRTAMLTGLTMLDINGINFSAKKGEIEEFAVKISVDHMDVPEIAR
jgi:death-on-curing protein